MRFETMARAALRGPAICSPVRSLKRALLLFFLILAGTLCARAQGTADVLGTVTDAGGGVIPNAKVTLTNVGTGISQTTQSSPAGDYIFPAVLIGTYTVKVEAPGFTTTTIAPFTVATGDRARADATLQVGQQATTVEVTAAAPALHTDTASLNTLVTSKEVTDLPLNGRNIVNLVWLSAGAQPATGLVSGSGPDDRRQTSGYSVNGQNAYVNSNMIDGMDNNEIQLGGSAVRPSVDAIQEVNVSTNNFDASYTKTGGANVDVVTKSGTNSFHGTGYEFFRNAVLNTNPAYQFPAGYTLPSGGSCHDPSCATLTLTPLLPKPAFRQNQFGGSLGGPIKKNKTFFFGDYEGLIKATGTPSSNTVPTLCNRGMAVCPDGKTQFGDFSDQPQLSQAGGSLTGCNQNSTACPGYLPPAQTPYDPIGLAYFSMYPLPNGPAGLLTGNYSSSPVTTYNSKSFDARFDQHFSDSNTLFVRYSFNNVNVLVPGAFPAVTLTSAQDPLITGSVTVHPGPQGSFAGPLPGPSHARQQGFALSYSHVYSANLVLSLKAGVTRSLIHTLPLDGNQPNLGTALGFPCNGASCVSSGTNNQTGGIPNITVSGEFSSIGGDPFVPITHIDNTFDYRAALTWIRGSQTIKFGADLVRRRNIFAQSNNPMGTFTFTGAYLGTPGLDLLAGLSTGITRQVLVSQPHLRSWEPGGYVQDDWRVKHWLTLNLGVRYDIFTPYTESNGNFANFSPSIGLMVSPSIAGYQKSGPTAGIKTSYRDVAPRFGFAFTLPDKTVVRGGFGLSYFVDNIGSTSSMINPPFASNFTCTNQNKSGTNNACGSPFTNGAVQHYGNTLVTNNSSTINFSGGALFSQGEPVPSLNLLSVLAPASCTATSIPTSVGCTFVGGDFYAANNPSAAFLPAQPNNYLEVYNLSVEKQFKANVISLGFVGNLGRDLRTTTYNPTNKPNYTVYFNPLAALPNGSGGVLPGAFPWLNSSSFSQQNKWGSSSYQSMQASYVRRFTNGLSATVNYTWSHSIWDGQGYCQPVISYSELGYGSGPNYQYPCLYDNLKNPGVANAIVVQTPDAGSFNTANSTFDVRHRVTFEANYDLPFAKSAKGIEGGLVKGWSANLAGAWQTGLPFSVANGANKTGTASAGSPDAICDGEGHNHTELMGWVNTSCFTLPSQNTFGTARKQDLFGPHQRDADFSIFKTFSVTEKLNMQFRAEVFNLFNTPNFANPSGAGATLSCYGAVTPNPSGNGGTCANAADSTNKANAYNASNLNAVLPGTITSLANATEYNSRQIQFALKFIF
jgi:hypothetical protein